MAMQHPDVVRRLTEIGVAGVGSSPQELDRFWRALLDYRHQAGGVAGKQLACPPP